MLTIDKLAKTFPNGTNAISDFNLEVDHGEVVAIIGGSGCGKSTLLRLVAGLERATDGLIVLRNKPLIEPDERVTLVFRSRDYFRG